MSRPRTLNPKPRPERLDETTLPSQGQVVFGWFVGGDVSMGSIAGLIGFCGLFSSFIRFSIGGVRALGR